MFKERICPRAWEWEYPHEPGCLDRVKDPVRSKWIFRCYDGNVYSPESRRYGRATLKRSDAFMALRSWRLGYRVGRAHPDRSSRFIMAKWRRKAREAQLNG